jgi:hypothetical protein
MRETTRSPRPLIVKIETIVCRDGSERIHGRARHVDSESKAKL